MQQEKRGTNLEEEAAQVVSATVVLVVLKSRPSTNIDANGTQGVLLSLDGSNQSHSVFESSSLHLLASGGRSEALRPATKVSVLPQDNAKNHEK